MKQQDNSLWQVIKGYFNALPDKENEAETIRQISAGITFRYWSSQYLSHP